MGKVCKLNPKNRMKAKMLKVGFKPYMVNVEGEKTILANERQPMTRYFLKGEECCKQYNIVGKLGFINIFIFEEGSINGRTNK